MRNGTDMELYFSPLSCSLASRIAIYEAGLDAEVTFHPVTLSTKQYDAEAADYWRVAPKGQVPALVTRGGTLLTENAAVLQYIADLAPAARLAPAPAEPARYELQEWLSFIGTELHKNVFFQVFAPDVPAESKAFALGTVLPKRFDYLSLTIGERAFLVGDAFTVADAYLVTVLNWVYATPVKLERWPVLVAYHQRMAARPQVRRAYNEEKALR